MPVYSYRMIGSLQSALHGMSLMMFGKLPLVLGADEFLAAFVDPDHVPMLKQVQEMCRPTMPSYSTTVLHHVDGETLTLQIQFAGSAPVILPQYATKGLQPTCPPELKAKIETWVNERVELGRKFGDAKDAITYLNDTCGDVEAMAVMLPCLPSIMAGLGTDGDSKAVRRAQKLTSIKRFGRLPRVPREVTKRLADVSAVVNAVSLMKDAPDRTYVRHDAIFSLTSISGHTRPNIFYLDAPMQSAPAASFL